MKRAIAVLLLLTHPAWAADVVRMKNGDIFRGEIVEQKMNQYIQIRFTDGNEKRLKWSQVDKIEKHEDAQPEAPTPAATQIRPHDDGSGLISAGWTVWGSAYLLSVIGGTATGTGLTAIPVIGNFVQLAAGNNQDGSLVALNVLGGIAQVVGVGLLIAGYSARSSASASIVPTLNGANFVMRF